MNYKRKHGFTIVEIETVVAIVATLAVLIVVGVINHRHRANYAKAYIDMESIADAARMIKQETGSWPVDESGTTPYNSTGLQEYYPKPTPPCSGWFYDWENWMAPLVGLRDIIKVSLRNPNAILADSVVYHYCLSKGMTDACKLTNPWDTDSLPIESLSDKKITCKELQ